MKTLFASICLTLLASAAFAQSQKGLDVFNNSSDDMSIEIYTSDANCQNLNPNAVIFVVAANSFTTVSVTDPEIAGVAIVSVCGPGGAEIAGICCNLIGSDEEEIFDSCSGEILITYEDCGDGPQSVDTISIFDN